MPYVRINETDSTIYNNTSNTNDNIVFIPGVATTGPVDTAVLCESYKDFVRIFGKTAPVTNVGSYGTSWDYAVNMLLAGFPVLYYRIGTSTFGESLLSKASAEIKSNVDVTTITRKYTLSGTDITDIATDVQKQSYDEWVEAYVEDSETAGENPVATYIDGHEDITNTSTTEYTVATIEDKFGGSYGNTYAYTITYSTASVLLKIFALSTVNNVIVSSLVETIKLADISDIQIDAADYDILVANRILNTWGGVVDGVAPIIESDYVTINFNNTDNNLVNALAELGNITEYVRFSGGADADNDIISTVIPTIYSQLVDKYLYDVKFITSGGYTDVYGTNDRPIGDAMIELAETRQDCIAIIDPSTATPAENVQDFFKNFNTSYATAYAPWCYIKTLLGNELWMPPSYIALSTLANSVSTGNVLWNPPAGVNRATVTSIIKPQYEINSSLLDAWQNTDNVQCINPIMKLRQYGYVIYGQRTLYYIVNNDTNKRSALQELGVRITANEIKRAINNISISMTFEQNNIRTWNEFRGRLDPYLAQMKADRGIYDYEIKMDSTTTTIDDISNNTIRGLVRASISRASEKFIIGFEITSASTAILTEDDEII